MLPEISLEIEICPAGLDRALGLRDEPDFLGIARWPAAIPQPDREHPRRIAALGRALADYPRLALAGGYLDGVAVGDAIASGVAAAARLVDRG